MLYDLNIPWSPSTDPAALDNTLAFSANLGYNVVALNHTLSHPIPPQIVNPLPKIQTEGGSDGLGRDETQPQPQQPRRRKPKVLHRATVILTDPSQQYRLATVAAAYDILALRPTTDKAFSAACLSINEASLISLDLTARYPFFFRPKPCAAAVARGLRFEVCYSQFISGAATSPGAGGSGHGHAIPAPDAKRAHANFISNLGGLIRATRGRGIILSSEAADALYLRAPADVVNLMAVWGLPVAKGTEGLGIIPRGVIVNEGLKRTAYKGVVDIVEVAAREGDAVPRRKQQKGQGDDEAASSATEQASGKTKKRKNNEGSQAFGGQTSEPQSDAASEQQQMSKRQAKKLRKAQKADAES